MNQRRGTVQSLDGHAWSCMSANLAANHRHMVIVADVNSVWRRKPFAALAELRPVLGLAPSTITWPQPLTTAVEGERAKLCLESPQLIPGWASTTAWLAQKQLWRIAERCSAGHGHRPSIVVITTPHYLPLLSRVPADTRIVYYASDDYRSYVGLSWRCVARHEREIAARSDLLVFVSEALAARCRVEHPEHAGKVRVSMNATDASSLANQGEGHPVRFPGGLDLPRPVVGCIGAINDRVDFDILNACVGLDAVGTLLLVGQLPGKVSLGLANLLRHPKCVAVGHKPHAEIRHWMNGLDVALIPYRPSPLNFYCSPMRLFDHLASGCPIVSTDACHQVRTFSGAVAVARTVDEFVSRLELALIGRHPISRQDQVAEAERHTWKARAEALNTMFGDL